MGPKAFETGPQTPCRPGQRLAREASLLSLTAGSEWSYSLSQFPKLKSHMSAELTSHACSLESKNPGNELLSSAFREAQMCMVLDDHELDKYTLD